MMDHFPNYQNFQAWLISVKDWIFSNVFVFIWDNLIYILIQIGVLLGAWFVGTLTGRKIRKLILSRTRESAPRSRHAAGFMTRFLHLLPLICTCFFIWLGIQGLYGIGYNTLVMNLVLNLSIAWVIIQLVTSVILDRFWSKIIAIACWALAALNILGLMAKTMSLLNSIGFTVGDVRLTLLSVIKAILVLLILLRAVKWISGQLDNKLANVSELTPSARLMISKSINIALFVVVTLVALNSVGIDISALAFFSGAVGVGVGFGLQKIVGNFVSGLILLSDKSIKPGDVIEIADMYGWVKHMGGRCVSLVTRDEKELLIPNENLITQEVINWSYSTRKIRIRVPVGISYNADPHQAIQLIQNAVLNLDRVLKDPEPRCLLVGFGDNSVDLQLRFWIRDPQNGVANITSQVMLSIWDTLKENSIEIPFPQRDVHLDTQSPLRVVHVNGRDSSVSGEK